MIDENRARRIRRIQSHILSHFPNELEVPYQTDSIKNSIFWPGWAGRVEFCGNLFSHVDFTPHHGSTVGEVCEQLEAYARTFEDRP